MDEPPYPTRGIYPSHGTAAVPVGATSTATVPIRPAADVAPGAAKLEGQPFGAERRGLRKRIGSALAGIAAVAAKFGTALKALLVALPNAKIFLLIFIHEMGHVLQLRREGIKASAPMFIPFMGALITSKSLGDNALAEARVGLAGPVLGSLAAAAVAVVGELTGSEMLIALAYVGFLVNLFNLLPVVPLDGGRAMAAMAPWMWFVGFGALLVLLFVLPPSPILLIIVLFGAFELYRRWKLRKTGSLAQAAYYRVAPHHRLLVGIVYIGLAAGLAFGMSETHVLTSTNGETSQRAAQRRTFIARSMSRLTSRSRIVLRLSYRSFPRPSAISTFARPSLK
jgi:Zn-dependent protease